MKATIASKKIGKDGKEVKGLEYVTVSKELSEALYNAFVRRNEDGTPVSKTDVIQDATSLKDKVWDKLMEKYPTFESITLDDYMTTRSVTSKVDGNTVTKKDVYPARTLVKNLNLQAILAGIVSDLSSHEERLSKDTKTLLKLAVEEEAIGFNKGKRGRNKKIINVDKRTQELLASL